VTVIDLAGRTALVTGAGQGVGLEIARGLLAAGADVWVNDLDAERADSAVAALAGEGGEGGEGGDGRDGGAVGVARAVVADVTDPDAIALMIEATGPVDILVNNAGVPPGFAFPAPFVTTTPDEWKPWMALNVDAVMRITHGYVPHMQEAGWGRVLTIVSDAGRTGEPGQVVYGTAKAAAMGFTRGIAAETASKGVTANCIALGAIRHGVVAAFFDANPEAEAKGVKRYPVGRLGDPKDPVGLALVLCSDAGSWITGQVMPVDGGYLHAL